MPPSLPLMPGSAPPGAITQKYHDVTVVRKKTYAQARVMGVPPEEFGIERYARSLRECNYCFHEVIKSELAAIEEGFDKEDIKALPSYTLVSGTERLARDTVNESVGTGGGDDGLNVAARMVRITEHFVRMDYEGNGKSKLYCVSTGGEQGDILHRDGKLALCEIDAIPFAVMTPVIVTHRFFGKSVADLVMDIQRIKTALLRGLLDNAYAVNNPRPEVAESTAHPMTLDDLLISRHGAPVRVKQTGCVTWQEVPSIAQAIMPVISYMDSTREWRTGVTRQMHGLDPDALQNVTATASNAQDTAAQQKMKLIARIFAETGIRDLFQLLHGVIRKNAGAAETVRLRNQWVPVDPRDWKKRDDLTINVGLGGGNKQQQLAGLVAIAGLQEKAIMGGLPIVTPRNCLNTAEEITKINGFKNADKFFTDPSLIKTPIPIPGQPAQPPPDPMNVPIQKPPDPKLAVDQAKAQSDAAHQQMKTQADISMQQQKLATDSQLAQQKFELDAKLKVIDAQMKEREHQMTMQQHVVKLAGSVGQKDAEGNPKGPTIDTVKQVMDAMHPRPAAIEVVRHPPGHPNAGQIAHLRPAT